MASIRHNNSEVSKVIFKKPWLHLNKYVYVTECLLLIHTNIANRNILSVFNNLIAPLSKLRLTMAT